MPRARTSPLTGLLVAAAFAAACLSYWVIPYKLAFGAGGSFYTFGFHADEYDYAQRLQPLIPGTTPVNSINGNQDPALISSNYFEDTLRPVFSALHVDVVWFFWAWRLGFPLALLLLLILLARECIPRRYGLLVPIAAGAAAMPLIACAAELLGAVPVWAHFYMPLQGWLSHVPANIEYLLSAGLALLCLRFMKLPTYGRGLAVAGLSAAALYIRMYVALTSAPIIAAVAIWLLATGRLRFAVGAAMLALFVALIVPWAVVSQMNQRSTVFAEFMERAFGAWPFQISPLLWIYIGIAAALLLSAIFVASRYRALLIVAGLSMAAWPFTSGLFSFSRELMLYDHFGEFYWIALALAGMLALGAYAAGSRCSGTSLAVPLAVIAIVAGAALGYRNVSYNFLSNPESPYRNAAIDQAYVPAYTWIREHVDADAFFLVDDGYDWSLVYDGTKVLGGTAPDNTAMLSKADLFQIVARRKRVFNEHLMYCGISNARFLELMLLHRGTFGYPIDIAEYDRALINTWPTHILWRKLPLNPMPAAAIPRGFGKELRNFRNVIYEDNVCEIWELNFAQIRPIYRAPAHPLPSVRRTGDVAPGRMIW